MLKIIAILVLIWVFFRAVGMIFRSLLGSDTNRTTRYGNGSSGGQGRRHGNVSVDHDPNKTNKGYQGGEYVDYEEVE